MLGYRVRVVIYYLRFFMKLGLIVAKIARRLGIDLNWIFCPTHKLKIFFRGFQK